VLLLVVNGDKNWYHIIENIVLPSQQLFLSLLYGLSIGFKLHAQRRV